jgi:hypothetical protein
VVVDERKEATSTVPKHAHNKGMMANKQRIISARRVFKVLVKYITVAFRPKVHKVSPVTSIVHWLRCSEVDRGRHRLGNCSFCQVTSWTAPMQAHACLRVLELAKGDPRTHGVQEGTENY